MKPIPSTYFFSNLDLRKLIIPLILEQILSITLGVADTIMVSSVGEAAVSGVSLVDMVNVVVINIFAALATGGAVITAQFLGRKRQDLACKSAGQLLLIVLGISVLLSVVMVLLRTPLLRLLFGSIEEDVMRNSLTYLVISAYSYPFVALYNACAALFRSMGNAKVSLKTALLMNIVNVGANALLIFGFQMGVAGAALGSLFARFVSAAVMLYLITKPSDMVYVRRSIRSFIPDGRLMANILRIGIPNGFENSLFQLGRVLVVSIIAVFGTTQIAANAVANNIDGLACVPGQAMSLAMITVVGRCIGARDFEQAVYYIKKLLKITYMIMGILIICILTSLPLILKAYNLSPETLRLARMLIMIHNGCAMLIWPLAFTLPNALRAASDVRYTLVVAVFSMAAFRILLSYVLGWNFGLGAVGVWIAMIADWVFRAAFFVWRAASGKWKDKCFL